MAAVAEMLFQGIGAAVETHGRQHAALRRFVNPGLDRADLAVHAALGIQVIVVALGATGIEGVGLRVFELRGYPVESPVHGTVVGRDLVCDRGLVRNRRRGEAAVGPQVTLQPCFPVAGHAEAPVAPVHEVGIGETR